MNKKRETDEFTEIFEATLEEDLAYIKSIELEFADGVDDMLKTLNLSHLRVKPMERILLENNN